MSSPKVFEMPTRHPKFVKLLREVFKISMDDFNVLLLCHRDYKRSKFGLSHSESKKSRGRVDSIAHLLKQQMIEFNDTNQAWEVSDHGRMALEMMQLHGEYPVAPAEKGDLVEFPRPNRQRKRM